jgi:hypothetical protein
VKRPEKLSPDLRFEEARRNLLTASSMRKHSFNLKGRCTSGYLLCTAPPLKADYGIYFSMTMIFRKTKKYYSLKKSP